jgi:hypothetical protein
MKTGDAVFDLGLYTTECCSEELTFEIGDTFSRCPGCHAVCEWEFQYELRTLEDLESADRIAG